MNCVLLKLLMPMTHAAETGAI